MLWCLSSCHSWKRAGYFKRCKFRSVFSRRLGLGQTTPWSINEYTPVNKLHCLITVPYWTCGYMQLHQLLNMKTARSTTGRNPPALRAFLLWSLCTFWKGGVNAEITSAFRGSTRTQPVSVLLFQPQGLGDHRILSHSQHLPPFPELPPHKTTISCASSFRVNLPWCFTANSSVRSEAFYFI